MCFWGGGWYPNAHYVEWKTGTEIPKLSIIGLLKKVLANNFALSEAEDNTTRSLNRVSIADLALLGTLLAMCQKSSEPSFWITSLFELYFKTLIYFVGKNKKKRFLWVMAAAQALKTIEMSEVWPDTYINSNLNTLIVSLAAPEALSWKIPPMEHLSNNHKDHPNQHKHFHKLCNETGHPVLSLLESQWKVGLDWRINLY